MPKINIKDFYKRYRSKERRFVRRRHKNDVVTPFDILYLVEEGYDYFKMVYEEYKEANKKDK